MPVHRSDNSTGGSVDTTKQTKQCIQIQHIQIEFQVLEIGCLACAFTSRLKLTVK